jgi:hypothetical protein
MKLTEIERIKFVDKHYEREAACTAYEDFKKALIKKYNLNCKYILVHAVTGVITQSNGDDENDILK